MQRQKQKIKLLHITSSLKIGGAESVLCDLIKNLDASRFEHHVIYFHPGLHLQTLQKMGIATYRVCGAISLYDPAFMFRLYRLVKKIHPSVIHTLLWAANVGGRMVGAMLKIPVISAFHNNVDQDGAVRAFFDRTTLRMANTLIAVSDGVADSVRQRDPWLPPARLAVIPNGIDVTTLHNKNKAEAVTRNSLGLCPTDFVIGSVGRFVPVKRYDLLLNAFAQLQKHKKGTKLVLVGTGPLEKSLQLQAHALGLENAVLIVGGQPAYRYYSLFDCFVQSTDKEGISIALLEAMSFGLPCIVTNAQEKHAVITHLIDGLQVPAGDAHAIAQACQELIDNTYLYKKIAHAARVKVNEQFSIGRMIERYDEIFAAPR